MNILKLTNEQRAHDLVISQMPDLIKRSIENGEKIGRVEIYLNNYKEVLTKMNDLSPSKWLV